MFDDRIFARGAARSAAAWALGFAVLAMSRRAFASDANPHDDVAPRPPPSGVADETNAPPGAVRPDVVGEPSPAVRITPFAAAMTWGLLQLIPSPLYVATSDRVGGGVRWQVTPFLYSFGVAARPVRAFVIEPVARHTGAIELFVSPEWACCAAGEATSFLARGGGRLYFPLIGRGEALTASVGGSYYRAGDGSGASVEAGMYVLFASLGLTVTVSPRLTGREVISAFHVRYF